jgi:protein ImuA
MRITSKLIESSIVPKRVARLWPSGIASLDAALAGGLAYGRVHEVYAAEADDASAAAGFVVALATGMGTTGMEAIEGDGARTALWLRSERCVRRGGILNASGWAEMGAAPEQYLFGVVADAQMLLRAAVDALRSSALAAVVVESWGRMAELDLTASRRLALAAEKSGVPLFLLRIDAAPIASAAQTRWQVASAPSHALPGHAPGWATFDIELLRQRSGPSGLRWRLEWDRDQHIFRDAAISGAVVPVPFRRPTAETGTGSLRQVA